MSFIVHARAPAHEVLGHEVPGHEVPGREVSYRRGSMLGALEQALALASCGMEGVRITDLRGRAYTPSEFSRSLRADAADREGSATRAA